MSDRAREIAAAFIAACGEELDAPKPGNVHVFAPHAQLTVDHFIRSAAVAAGPLSAPGASVGARILGAVEATLAAVHTNTNLGIVLLCAPLAAAAERHAGDLRAGVVQVLDALDAEDAAGAFQAIVRAWPAGLGRSPVHDVFEPARVTLRKAMAAAADRDRVAYNYASAFEDVFERGEPWLAAALARMPDRKWATLAVYLGFLAAFPDSHIVRKHGRAAAEDVRRQAARFHARLLAGDPQKLLPDLLAWDASLKANSLNPGTSADLTVVTLFADRLRRILPPARNGGSL